jgi:hypothetical protein
MESVRKTVLETPLINRIIPVVKKYKTPKNDIVTNVVEKYLITTEQTGFRERQIPYTITRSCIKDDCN